MGYDNGEIDASLLWDQFESLDTIEENIGLGELKVVLSPTKAVWLVAYCPCQAPDCFGKLWEYKLGRGME